MEGGREVSPKEGRREGALGMRRRMRLRARRSVFPSCFAGAGVEAVGDVEFRDDMMART